MKITFGNAQPPHPRVSCSNDTRMDLSSNRQLRFFQFGGTISTLDISTQSSEKNWDRSEPKSPSVELNSFQSTRVACATLSRSISTVSPTATLFHHISLHVLSTILPEYTGTLSVFVDDSRGLLYASVSSFVAKSGHPPLKRATRGKIN